MSRRQDREGVPRCEMQYGRNLEQDSENYLDPKGWYVPHLAWEGWCEFNLAVYALQCVMIWRRLTPRLFTAAPAGPLIRDDGTIDRDQLCRVSDLARIESDLRSFRFHIARSSRCDRPELP